MLHLSHRKKLIIIFIIALICLGLQFLFHQAYLAKLIITLVGSLISISMIIEMINTIRSGRYGVDLLAILAISSTLFIGEYWASLIVLIMLVGGDTLEDYAANKANQELKSLLDNSPQTAHKLVNDSTVAINVNDVLIDDILLVKPNELIPVDGTIIKGSTLINEASLTGESQPQAKGINDSIMSGSLNGDNSIYMRVTKLAKDSQYQKLVRLVEQAQQTPAHFVRLADRYAIPFTIIAILLASWAWWYSKDIRRFAEVLVVASPCPLILAAPVALVAGMSRSSKEGIIVKNGNVLEKLASAKSAAFDKTGTITSGMLSVDRIHRLNGISQLDILYLAASVEQESSHILGRAVVEYARQKHITLAPLESLKEVTGNGVQAVIAGKVIKVGKLKYVAPDSPMEPLKTTAIYISADDILQGYITFIDHVRPEANETMQQLHNLGISNLYMLTGDQSAIAKQVAHQVGINQVKADLLPEDKIRELKKLTKKQRPVIMVGDGVNDAPCLAQADIGIAMGANGSTAASEAADAVIVKDDLMKVISAIKIAKNTLKIARQAVLLGIFICSVLMIIASFGYLPAIYGALCQEVIDTVAILWALKARFNGKKIS